MAAIHGVAWGDDLHAHKCTHPFIDGDICRDAGHVAYPEFKSQYVDYVWEQVAYKLDRARPRLDVIQESYSFMPAEGATRPKMQADLTVLESRFMRQADKKLADERLPAIIDEVVARLRTCGW